MYCTNCGEKLIDQAITCPSCGTDVRQAPSSSEVATTSEFRAIQSESQEPPRRLSDQTKKLILVGMAAVVIVFLVLKFTGGAGSQATPEKAVKGFFNAVKQQDAKKMFQYLSISANDEKDLPEGLDKESAIRRLEGQFDETSPKLGSIEIKDVNIEEDSATVDYKVDLKLEGEESTEEGTMELTKVKGKWYVDINIL
jgi:hypothetical protein